MTVLGKNIDTILAALAGAVSGGAIAGVVLAIKAFNILSSADLNNVNEYQGIADFYLFDSEINKTNIIDRWNFWGRWEEPDYHLMIPKSLIYPIKKKTFEFGTCGIPAQEVETVKYLYGERWMHPSDKGKQYTTIMKNGRPYVVYL